MMKAPANWRCTCPRARKEQALKDTVKDWLQRQAHALFAQRLPLYAMRLGVQYGAFKLTSARTQWGSCTAKRHHPAELAAGALRPGADRLRDRA